MSNIWTSLHGQDRNHYNQFRCKHEDGMTALREMFPTGEANYMNFCLFSTSGIHGSYITIEDVENEFNNGNDKFYEEDWSVTFVIIQPRTIAMFYGNCKPQSKEDFDYLKKLRQSSWDVVYNIGRE